MDTATVAGGCFWCTEAIFKRLKGVGKVTPGYTGGDVENPSYEAVCSGNTGHAEAVQIEFDPKVISFEKLLEVFFKLHDPTTLNQQGNDVGTQYRSAIFYYSNEQKEIATKIISKLQVEFDKPIVTKLEQFSKFYPAESYHRDYYDLNRSQPYCQIVIDPKIQKLYRDFKDDLKT